MHALSLSDGLFPCISLMRVMHRGLAMHPSNHLEMWNHVNPYKGRFNTLENVSWELVCVLPQSMSGVQWTVAWSLWSVNRESSIFRAWQSRARADWRNTELWADISIMEAVCVISANRLGVARGEGSTARTRRCGNCNIKMHWTILSNSLLSWSVSSVWFLFQCPQANNYSTYWTALTWRNVPDAITNSNNLAHLNRDGEEIATWNG